MNIEKGKIERGDEVYATLSLAGKTIVELKQVNDVSGIEDVMRKLRLLAGLYTGMARVYIRNRSKGWAMQLSMLMCKSVRSLRTRSQLVAEANIREGENKSLTQEQKVIFMCMIVITADLEKMCQFIYCE